MDKYEEISTSCKMLWRENFDVTGKKVTQVSGYVFNDEGKLLIVHNKETNTWTIPGGHLEPNETREETLKRELMEEACVTLKDINYLGAVEVVEDETYYQTRYTAHINEALPFKEEWEIDERKFVTIDELPKYITWANGVTFRAQINSTLDFWKNK